LTSPQRPSKPHSLKQPSDALLERHTGGCEFRADVWHIRGYADTENQSAFCNLIERCNLMRENNGIAERREQNSGPDVDPWHAACYRGEQCQRFMARASQQGIAHPEGVKSQALGTHCQFQQWCGLRLPDQDLFSCR
jgi:hypothetical protein